MNVVSSWSIMPLYIHVEVPFHALSVRWPNADVFKSSRPKSLGRQRGEKSVASILSLPLVAIVGAVRLLSLALRVYTGADILNKTTNYSKKIKKVWLVMLLCNTDVPALMSTRCTQKNGPLSINMKEEHMPHKKKWKCSGRRGGGPVTMLTSLLLEEHSQVRWLAVSSVYRGASLAWRLTALKCHISTVMNSESARYSQTSLLQRPH